MTVQFFRVTIKGTETKLNTIKDWIDSKVESLDLDENIGGV